MSQFWAVVGHEFNMSVRRKGLWVAYLIAISVMITEGLDQMHSGGTPWQEAGESVYLFNMLTPVIGGILAADRMQRDYRLGVRELQISTPLKRSIYIGGKYLGVLLSLVLPLFLWALAFGILTVALGLTGPAMIGTMVVAFLAIAVPSFAFVTAFSLACPLVMPLRVYQILFTGYWFWGNYISDEVFPTISGTLLNASGVYAQQGLFGGAVGSFAGQAAHTAPAAWLNILVLGACAAAALFTLDRYLARQSRKA